MEIFTPCAIALGGNLGDSRALFAAAVAQLRQAGLRRARQSSLLRNPAVACPPGTPDFVNAVVVGEWPGTPEQLLAHLQRLEVAAGRPREHGFHQSRTLDLDLILFGMERRSTPELTLPHPRARQRRFVLEPLAELVPDWRFPEGDTVREALARLRAQAPAES